MAERGQGSCCKGSRVEGASLSAATRGGRQLVTKIWERVGSECGRGPSHLNTLPPFFERSLAGEWLPQQLQFRQEWLSPRDLAASVTWMMRAVASNASLRGLPLKKEPTLRWGALEPPCQ